MMRSFEFCFLVLLFSVQWRLKNALPQETLRIIEEKEALVNRLAKDAATLFKQRGELVASCECSVHICRAASSQTACEIVKRQLSSLCSGYKCPSADPGANSYIQTPPNVATDAVSAETKESICLYQYMESTLAKSDPNARTTTRISTKEGTSRVFPGTVLRKALLEVGPTTRDACEAMDPRRTSEYVGASVGPKDIIFVIDSSRDMSKPWEVRSNISRLDSVSHAMASMLDALSAMDRVNFVAYSDKARRRGTGKPLFPGTPHNLYLIKSSIKSLYPQGNSTLRDGIKLGFRLLTDSNRKRRRKSKFRKGQKVMVVITGSSDHGSRAFHSEFLRDLERRQKQLRALTGVQATIFTYSIGEDVDNTLLKQIACANGGAWFQLRPTDDPYEVLNAYNTFLAARYEASYPIWTNFKASPYGRGLRTTVAKAFHFRPSNGAPKLLQGVISHEVRLKDLALANATHHEIEIALMHRSRKHDAVKQDSCQIQVFRNVYAGGVICVDQLPTQATKKASRKSESRKRKRKKPQKQRSQSPPCFEHGGVFYKAFLEPVDWETAAASCQEDEGELAQVSSLDNQAFLAGMAGADGAWIGARGNPKGRKFRWEAQGLLTALPQIESASTNVSSLCVRLDNRGAVDNLDGVPCDHQLPYLCAYSSEDQCPSIVRSPRRGYFTTPPLNLCIQYEEALDDAGAVSAVTRFPASHLWCSIERPGNLLSMCCRSC